MEKTNNIFKSKYLSGILFEVIEKDHDIIVLKAIKKDLNLKWTGSIKQFENSFIAIH